MELPADKSCTLNLSIPGFLLVVFLGLVFLAAACQPSSPACPPESISYLHEETSAHLAPADHQQDNAEQLIEINGQEIIVDQVVEGMLCNGRWSGTIYVPCHIQVYAWEENPHFLERCDLNIAPGTIVYVAAHNNDAYYQGCSCHIGQIE